MLAILSILYLERHDSHIFNCQNLLFLIALFYDNQFLLYKCSFFTPRARKLHFHTPESLNHIMHKCVSSSLKEVL